MLGAVVAPLQPPISPVSDEARSLLYSYLAILIFAYFSEIVRKYAKQLAFTYYLCHNLVMQEDFWGLSQPNYTEEGASNAQCLVVRFVV